MSSRDHILNKLRAVQKPFTDVPPIADRRRVSVINDTSSAGLRARFIDEATQLGCYVHPVTDSATALTEIGDILGDDTTVNAWSLSEIPLSGLGEYLTTKGITVTTGTDATARCGITGARAALAATGSLVMESSPATPRSVSLLPEVHIAVITSDQILQDFEAYFEAAKRDDYADLRAKSSIVMITGPSKTADIAQELIKGAHGPRVVHIILLP